MSNHNSLPRIRAEDLLRPQKCYPVLHLQELLGISVLHIIEAVQSAEITRHLGEHFETHVMGIEGQAVFETVPGEERLGLSDAQVILRVA